MYRINRFIYYTNRIMKSINLVYVLVEPIKTVYLKINMTENAKWDPCVYVYFFSQTPVNISTFKICVGASDDWRLHHSAQQNL